MQHKDDGGPDQVGNAAVQLEDAVLRTRPSTSLGHAHGGTTHHPLRAREALRHGRLLSPDLACGGLVRVVLYSDLQSGITACR